MTGSTSLGGVEGTGISNLVVTVTDCTLQFNRNYTVTMQVGEGDRSVIRLGDLSKLPFIGGLSIMHSCTTKKRSKNIIPWIQGLQCCKRMSNFIVALQPVR